MENKTTLPAEVEERIDKEAKLFAFYNYCSAAFNNEAKFENIDTWPFAAQVSYHTIKNYMGLNNIVWPYDEPRLSTEYALKWQEAQQDIESLRRWKMEAAEMLSQIHAYAHKNMEVELGQCNVRAVIERCKQFDAARALLEKFISRHEAGLLPDRLLYTEIKTFLNGK